MGKAEDPRKWSRQKWLSHLRATAPKLFGTLDDLSIGDMLDGSKCCFVRRGARVVRQGERGTSMFVVVLGKMHVVVTDAAKNRGEPLQVATMLAGDFFGEIALMTGEERRATVMAPYEGDGNVWVLEFSKSDVGSVILARPNVLRTLTDVCADRRLEKF
jgi:CRP-like cAMP-binding protein